MSIALARSARSSPAALTTLPRMRDFAPGRDGLAAAGALVAA